MIVKNLTRKKTGTGQLVRYIFRYILKEEKQAPVKESSSPFIITHNVRSKSVDGYIQEFKENLLRRTFKRSDQTIIHHTILSWSHKDAPHINDNLLRDIATQFIKLRGENNLFVGTKHVDRKHTHLHIAVSGNQINGRSSRLSKQTFTELKLSLDAYQKQHYPELANSLPEHGRSMAFKRSKKELGIGLPLEPVGVTGKEAEERQLLELNDLRELGRDHEIEYEREQDENNSKAEDDLEDANQYQLTSADDIDDDEDGFYNRKRI